MNIDKDFSVNNWWFLQTTLPQKMKEQVLCWCEENYTFDEILKFIALQYPRYADIQAQYTSALHSSSFSERTILTRSKINELRSKPLSLNAPLALEYRGNPNILSHKLIGIIGSRRPTYYGRLQAQKFAQKLSEVGYGIISGGAIGIDAIANASALKSDCGGSIGVIGNGILHPYPATNFNLFKNLAHSKNGLLMSEFNSSEPAQKWNFPKRNATIAELCDALLVIEAQKTSGSLMTAKFALECGKPVCALPGNVDNLNTAGSHLLIQNGAHCVHSVDDMMKIMERFC